MTEEDLTRALDKFVVLAIALLGVLLGGLVALAWFWLSRLASLG